MIQWEVPLILLILRVLYIKNLISSHQPIPPSISLSIVKPAKKHCKKWLMIYYSVTPKIASYKFISSRLLIPWTTLPQPVLASHPA